MAIDDELQRYLGQLPFKMKRQLAGAIKTEADRLASAIKAAAPFKTGTLRESVKVRRKRNDLDLEVTAGGEATTKEVRNGSGDATYDYSLSAEFGSRNKPAQPFFYSTARAMQAEIRENIEAAVAEALK